MPWTNDANGTLAWFNNGQFFYPDADGNITLTADEYYAAQSAALAAAAAQSAAYNSRQYTSKPLPYLGYSSVSGTLPASHAEFDAAFAAGQDPPGLVYGSDFDSWAIWQLMTPAQRGTYVNYSNQLQASNNTSFDKFMQTAVIGTLAAIATAGVATEAGVTAGDAADAGAEQLAGPGVDTVSAPIAPVDTDLPVQLAGPTDDYVIPGGETISQPISPVDQIVNTGDKAINSALSGVQKALTGAVVSGAAKILNPPKAGVVTPPSGVITPGAPPSSPAPAAASPVVPLLALAALAFKFL